MKKTLISLLLLLTLVLSACSTAAATNIVNSGSSTSAASSIDQKTTVQQSSSSTTSSTPAQGNTNGGPGNPPSGGAPGQPPQDNGTGANAGAPIGGGSSSAADGLKTASGAYSLNSGIDTQSGQTFTAGNQDQSGVYVSNGASLTLKDSNIKTTGNTSSDSNSSFYGLNAGVLAATGSSLDMSGGSITTTGTGANGAFAEGQGTTVKLSNLSITASGDGGHGVMATQGGTMTLANVDMTTSGAHSAPIATDRGGGIITSSGGSVKTSGADSPCYYSTGTLNITENTCSATGSEVAVIEGANTVNLTDVVAASNAASKWAVMLYQSFSGDAQGSDGLFNMSGGSLNYTDGTSPLFYITNTVGHITLKGVTVTAASGVLLKAEGNDRWGTKGSNGGTVDFTGNGQSLQGNFLADKLSTLRLTLENSSSLAGAINGGNTAKSASLTLDASSTWNVTDDSYLTCLSDPAIAGTTVANITGNGHTIAYSSSACSALNGLTYTLNGGGSLTPDK